MIKALLFDLDGVLSIPQEVFSVIYTKANGYELTPFTYFFENEWNDFVIGKRDLKEHIRNHPDLWKWHRSPDELLHYWFECQNDKNVELVDEISKLRKGGVPCYIATEQEKYRTDYIRTVMFERDVDGIFSTADIGHKKNDVRFYEYIVNSLSLRPEEIIFFDDSQSKIDTAKLLGINAHLYQNVNQAMSIINER